MTGDNRQNREKNSCTRGQGRERVKMQCCFPYFPNVIFHARVGRAYVRMWPGVSGLDPVLFFFISFALPFASVSCPVPLCAASAPSPHDHPLPPLDLSQHIAACYLPIFRTSLRSLLLPCVIGLWLHRKQLVSLPFCLSVCLQKDKATKHRLLFFYFFFSLLPKLSFLPLSFPFPAPCFFSFPFSLFPLTLMYILRLYDSSRPSILFNALMF